MVVSCQKLVCYFFSRQKIEHFVADYVYNEISDLFDIPNASILREMMPISRDR